MRERSARRLASRGRATIVGIALLWLACPAPHVGVETVVGLPRGLVPDAALMHVTLVKACKSNDVSDPKPPAPPTPGSPGPYHGAELWSGVFVVRERERSARCFFHLAAWYDTNGNGRADSGDATGRLPEAVLAVERPCSDNIVRTGPIIMKTIP